MLDAQECPHRQPFTPAELNGTPLATCALINGYLGWKHGFTATFCQQHCLANANQFPEEFVPGQDDSLNQQAKSALRSRLRDGRSDQDPTNPWRSSSWQHCSRHRAMQKAKDCGLPDETIADSLVVAVERGLPSQDAMELAKKHGVVV